MLVPSISAIIPAFNEERAITGTVIAIADVLAAHTSDFEIIVVNDGSTDTTASVVTALQTTIPSLRMVSHPTNRGYGAALATGFSSATRELIFLTDGDKQFEVAELAGLLPLLGTSDLVIGYRRPRADPMIRRVYGWGWNMLVNTLFGYTARDVDCAFKLVPTRIARELGLRSHGHTFSPELLIKARRRGYRVAEVRVTHLPRLLGEPKGARLDLVVTSLIELARLRLDIAAWSATSAK